MATAIKWLGIGLAFVAGVATPGCATPRTPAVGDARPAVTAAPAPVAAEVSSGAEKPAPAAEFAGVPTVNVFGEMPGQPPASLRPLGQANVQQHTFFDEGADSSVAVDPTGRWMVYASTRNAEHADIYLQRVDGLSVTQLTDGSADNAFPVFSPDGQRIAFCSTRSGNWDLYVMDRDGRNVVQAVGGPGQDIHPTFSPDGTRLAYCSLSPRSNTWELWTVNLNTQERRMIGQGLFPAWSPDKSADRIAFQRARQRGSRWFSLWTLDLVDGEARRVTEVAVSTNSAIVSPAWSPDGQRLAFATIVEPARTRGVKPRGQEDIWVIDADGANRHRLTDGNAANLTPFWAVDNRVYFISDRDGKDSVWSVRPEPPKAATAGKEAPKDPIGSTDRHGIAD